MTTIEKTAKRILANKREIKKLNQEIKEDMQAVREHVQDTGEMQFGDAMAYERKNKAKFVGLRKSVKVSTAVDALMEELPMEYKTYKTDLDLAKLMVDQDADRELKKLFKKHGLKLEQDSEIQLKAF